MKHLSFIFFLFFSLYWGQNSKSQNSSSKSTTIPFVISDGVIFLKGEINGIGANIVWDNGFSYCGIDKSFSKKFGLEVNKVKKAMDGTGEIIGIGFTTIPSFKFGTIEKSKVKGVIFDSSVIPTDSKIDAIIGAELINQYIWDFNFDNNLLTVSKKTSQKEFVQEFPFVIGKDHIHFIPIELGNKKVYIHSDFGSNSQFLEVSPHFAQLIFDKNIPRLTLEGGISISVSGKSNKKGVSYLLKNSYGFATPTAELSPDFTPFVHITDHINEDAVLGNNFFINLGNLVIDPFEKKYKYYSSKKAPVPFNFTNFGFKVFLEEGKIKISEIIKESNNVKQYHLTPGDIILNIDGHTADFFKNNDMLINYVREKKSLSLTLKDGILIHLKKESFF